MPKERYSSQRVGVFVDVQNMYHSAKNLYQRNVDFGRVLKEAVGERQLIRAIAYVVKSGTREEEKFFSALSKSGFELKIKGLQTFPGGMKKADFDVGLCVDAIKLADRLDAVVLVSGDGDFIPLISYLKENKGCRAELMAFEKTASAKLIEASDQFTDLGRGEKFLL